MNRLIITEALDLNGVTEDSIIIIQTITRTEATRLVNLSLYSDDQTRQVIQSIDDDLICDLLNETREFGMMFARRHPRAFDLTTNDTVLLVKRHTGQVEEVLTFKMVEFEVTIVQPEDRAAQPARHDVH